MKSCTSITIVLNLLVALSATTRAAGQWSIDTRSCTLSDALFIVKEYSLVLASARRLAHNLTAPSQTTNTLVQYMFGTAQQDWDPISFPREVFGGGGYNNILGLANFAGSQTLEDLGEGDFKIFCNLNHYVPPDDDEEEGWYDSFTEYYYPDPLGKVQACIDGNPTPAGLQPPNALRTITSTGVSAISFCGWFFNRGKTAAFPDGSNFNSQTYTRMTAWWANTQPTMNWAEIDVFRLFDATFMHELIHTPAAGFKHDVAGRNSLGWFNARILSTNKDPVTGCQKNVDNFQELALANKLSALGYIVGQDGSLSR